jgi:hypothetical protein
LRGGNVPDGGIMGGHLSGFPQEGVVNHHHRIPRFRRREGRGAGGKAKAKGKKCNPESIRGRNAKREESAR